MSDFRRTGYASNEVECVVMMGYEDVWKKARWGPCKRTRHILHYVTKGTGYFNGHPVSAGCGFYIRPEEVSEYHPDPDDPWNYFWMIVSEDLAKKYVVPYLCPDENGLFPFGYTEAILQKRKQFFSSSEPMTPPESLEYFFSMIHLHEKEQDSPETAVWSHVRNAKTYIEEHCGHHISVRDVAAAIHVDDRYLYNLFVRLEGTTPKRYLDYCRIRTAEMLLKDTGLSITEIAASAGFDDVCSFSRFFSRNCGISPTAYRNKEQYRL